MTFLNLDVRSKLTVGLLVALGCSSKVEIAESSSGGQSSRVSGGSAATGGNTAITDGGAGRATGGTWNATGGAGNSGGTWNATGGTWPATGGNATGGAGNSGGTWNATGGAAMATGGTMATATGGAAWIATGGAAPSYPNVGCTFGADQTCNDDLTVSTLMGHCEADGWCTCIAPYEVISATGKCNTHEQSVCYSPTQNIDLAYVTRAIGCHCSSSTSTPYCGIDSGGLRVYLVCTGGVWQSGDTSNCQS